MFRKQISARINKKKNMPLLRSFYFYHFNFATNVSPLRGFLNFIFSISQFAKRIISCGAAKR